MVASVRSPKKAAYIEKLNQLVETYQTILIVKADHVGSKQMAEIRLALRGKACMLMGKNTMIRTALRNMSTKLPEVKSLIGRIRQNIGLIFCIEDSSEIRKIVLENKVPAPARQGAIAPVNVVIHAGPTSLDPSQTSFFQALGIATKLVKGQIEIQTDVNLINVGEKVTASQSALLKKLNILPFNYGLGVLDVYDNGFVYEASVLDITNQDILKKFSTGIQNVAALSRQTGLPNEASIVHAVLQAFKSCVAIGLKTDIIFPEMQKIKHILDNPEEFQTAAATAKETATEKTTEQAETQKQDEEEVEEEEDFGFSLFE